MEKKEKLKQEKLNQGSGKVVTNDLNGNQLYPKETKEYLKQKEQIEKRELRKQKTEDDPNSGCCSGDPCGGSGGGSCFCDAECCDLVILILCCPIMIFD